MLVRKSNNLIKFIDAITIIAKTKNEIEVCDDRVKKCYKCQEARCLPKSLKNKNFEDVRLYQLSDT